MAEKSLNDLIKKIESQTLPKSSEIKPWYNKSGDSIEYLTKKVGSYDKWIDNYLTVTFDLETNEPIGFKLSNIKKILEDGHKNLNKPKTSESNLRDIDQGGIAHEKFPKIDKGTVYLRPENTYITQYGLLAQVKTKKGFVINIEEDTINNDNFRKVLYTGKNSQLVLMSIKPGEDIGSEVHGDTNQFFKIESGSGKVIINDVEHSFSEGFAFIVPVDTKHNIINDGQENLKLYSIYSPPQHKDGTIHKTKEIAEKDDEHFDGKTTE